MDSKSFDKSHQRFSELLSKKSQEHGFEYSGHVDIDLALDSNFKVHEVAFFSWLENKFHGEMNYLERRAHPRVAPRALFSSAQSIQCIAIPYSPSPLGCVDPTQGPRYASYLRGPQGDGRDYHTVMKELLETLAKDIACSFDAELSYKVCVDTSAVLEKAWASLCGLGWVGKNTLLLHPKLGSYFFIGVILWSHPTGHAPNILPNYCGNCSRCLDKCPTDAFEGPRVLNSNRCISYWTLEKRGDLDLSQDDQKAMGNWVAGCDVCQEVCPFNLKRLRSEGSPNPERFLNWPETWEDHLNETEQDYLARIDNSALDRIKFGQFKRNLSITAKNNYFPKQTE